MSFCINPGCTHPQNPNDQLFCKSCGSEVLLEGRYRVLMLLGQGGCGKTFEVSDRDGTVKVLKILSKNQPKYVELFHREAQVLSQLRHPGIPEVEPNALFTYLPRDSVEPLHCLVMEKITGLDLQKYILQRGSPIDQILAVQWLVQLSTILQVVHEQKFLHRDIKPSNIMLKADGHLVLIDFGTARTMASVSANGQESEQGTRIMSALYTPSEQVTGKPVPQSDFFALGRTFIYLLTARDLREFYDAETTEFQWRSALPNLIPSLADLLDQLMAPRVMNRPVNATVLLQKLTAIQKEFYDSSDILMPTQYEEEATKLAPHRLGNQGAVPTATPSVLSKEFVAQCQQELAEFIGPIATIICQRTLARNPQCSEQEFIEAIAAQISNAQDVQAFRLRLGKR
jgi:eukaryotic-like serine/threonine-protein kinase